MLTLRTPQTEALGKLKAAYERGVRKALIQLFTGGGKCLAKGTPVLMFDGSVKPVEDVVVGDCLMGPDSTPRTVLSLASGREEMFRVTPIKGDPYTVNKSHILSLKMTPSRRGDPHEIINISVAEYLSKGRSDVRHRAKGYRVGVDFPAKSVPLDPYFLGTWLGDGTSTKSSVSTTDLEIVEWLDAFGEGMGCGAKLDLPSERCPTIHLVRRTGSAQENPVVRELRGLGVLRNKHIPQVYKANSREVRLKILAGLLDTDGCLHHSGFDFISKYRVLADDVAFIARSLGLAAYVKESIKTCQGGFTGTYYRVSISGDCSVIPTILPRKMAPARRQKKNVLLTGIAVESVGEGDYYGFEIDGDRLFLLGDFTVTHNTVIFANVPRYLGFTRKALFLAHTEELTGQAVNTVQRWNDADSVGLEMASSYASLDDRFIVGSVATLGRAGSARLTQLDPEDFDFIVVDEAHHAPATTYQTILRHFGFAKDLPLPDKRLLLGVTATDKRGDGVGLHNVFDELVFQFPILRAIREGWLVNIRAYRVRTDTQLDDVRINAGDFDQGDLSLAVNTPARNRVIVEKWKEYGEDRRTIAFTVDIDHAKCLAGAFTDAGISAAAIWGDDPLRQEKLAAHKSGEIRVLANCGVLIEGYDDPEVACIILARPDRSITALTQKVGRGTRLPRGIDNLLAARAAGVPISKEDCIVLDVADNTVRHKLASVASLVGLPAKLNLDGRSVTEALDELQQLQDQKPEIDFEELEDLDDIQAYIERVDLFTFSYADEVMRNSELQWHKTPKGNYLLLFPGRERATITQDLLGRWRIAGSVCGNGFEDVEDAIEAALRQADKIIKMLGRAVYSKVKRESGSRWTKEAPTQAQIDAITAKLQRMNKALPDFSAISKHEASKILAALFLKASA